MQNDLGRLYSYEKDFKLLTVNKMLNKKIY